MLAWRNALIVMPFLQGIQQCYTSFSKLVDKKGQEEEEEQE